jgi:tetratricopeptide (TPR) repeat protein
MNSQLRQAVEAFQGGDLGRALKLAQSEVSGAPSPQAHHLLGLVHCRLGDPSAGLFHLRAAAEAEPSNLAFQIMLMRARIDAGRVDEVLEMPEPPPIRSGGALELWRARGEAAIGAKEFEKSAEAWRRIVRAVPDDWRAWGNLGSALASLERWDDAIGAFTQATRVNPSEPSIRWSLGAALTAAGRHEEALQLLDDFERLVGRTAESALARGRVALGLLRLDEAEQAYRDAVKLAPAKPDAVRELGLLLERTNRLQDMVELLEKAQLDGIPKEKLSHLYVMRAFREGRFEQAYELLTAIGPEQDPLGWNRMMAKIADRLGKSSEAFEAAKATNRMTPDFESWQERGAAYRRELRDLGRSLSEARQLPQLEKPARRMPAFLVGFPRSGTTLLDTFLMGHPDTEVLEEVHLLGAAERQIGKAAKLTRTSRSGLERARSAYFAELDLHVRNGFSGLVVDKLPLNLLGAPFIQAMFPGAHIIFMQRHPCDAVLSGFMQSFVMNEAMASFLTIEASADLYDSVMSGWFAIRQAFPLNVHTVCYERLIDDAESELRPLVDFLGLEWNDNMLAHTKTAMKRGAIITPSYDQVTEPLSTRSVGRWKRYRNQLEPVLPVLLPWAERLGYGE